MDFVPLVKDSADTYFVQWRTVQVVFYNFRLYLTWIRSHMADASIASGNFKNVAVLSMAVMDQLVNDM